MSNSQTTPDTTMRNISMTEICWKGDDGCFYRKYITEDGRVIHVEIMDKWPFAKISAA